MTNHPDFPSYFVQILRLRDMGLAAELFGGSIPPSIHNLGNLEVGQIEWWLEWIADLDSSGDNYWFLNQLGGLFAEHLDREAQDKFVAEFNKSSSKFRHLLHNYVLPLFSYISTDHLSEDAISFILAYLSREGSVDPFTETLLGNAATEQFVIERLLPLLPDAKQPLLKNLNKVLRVAGSRLGRRYIVEQPT